MAHERIWRSATFMSICFSIKSDRRISNKVLFIVKTDRTSTFLKQNRLNKVFLNDKTIDRLFKKKKEDKNI